MTLYIIMSRLSMQLWSKGPQFKSFSIAVTLEVFVCLFDLILYVPSTIFQLYRDGSSWVELVLS